MKEDPVYFFHGFGGQASDFHLIQESLKNIKTLSVDYTGDKFLSPDTFISDWGTAFWKWFDNQTDLNKNTAVTAVGYSQGGRLLLQAFQMAPERFKKLILISAHPGLQSYEEKEKRLAYDRKWAQNFRTLPWEELQNSWNSQDVFKGGKENIKNESDFDRELLARCFENWSLAHQQDFRSLILKYTDKIEIVVGEYDAKYISLYESLLSEKIEDKQAGRSAGEQGRLRLWKAKGAAHRVPSDQPDILVEILNSIILKS